MASSVIATPALPRTLSLIETLGFGLTGLLLWIGVAPGVQAELGLQAMWVWVPGAIFGTIINLQVRQLGQQLPHVAGGTPNYLSHLLPDVPWLTRYAAIGYFLSWVAVLPVNAIILTDLIQTNLVPLGIVLPGMGLKIGFVLLPFVVAFSGSRALSTLHLVFLLPAVGLLLAFCLQGSLWLLTTADLYSGAEITPASTRFSLQGWAKWYLNGTYAFYACETASAFVADSKQPQKTLQSLLAAAALIPLVYIAGSWSLLHLPSAANPQDTFLTFLAAADPYWGAATSLLVTFLIMSSCLLSLATAVSIAPRVLYQLAQDQQLSPLFGRVSQQGVFGPGLGLTLGLSLGCLAWGDLHQIVMVTGVGWLVAFIVLHGGLWQQRGQPGVMLPGLALAMAVVETFVLGVGGWAWGVQNFAVGLLLPLAVALSIRPQEHSIQSMGQAGLSAIKQQLVRIWPQPLPASSWANREHQRQNTFEDFIAVQVAMLVAFIGTAAVVSWLAGAAVATANVRASMDFLVVLVLVLSFLGVAIACWTIFPQIAAVNDARQSAEELSQELRMAFKRLQQTQVQMVQQEKLSSLGQLVAGVAHEINNPISFIHGNLTYAQTYVTDLLAMVQLYRTHYPDPANEIQVMADEIDLDFLTEDLPKMLNSMTLGTDRICEIVLSLRNFSRKDESACKAVNIHEGLESTLLILQHRLKATPESPETRVIRDYGELPVVECYPSQLNQVFMNILANALDAMAESNAGRSYEEIAADPNQVTLRTNLVGEKWVEIAITDNGPGIPEAVKDRIFDPFFTTKPVGKGTGLGMSISYQIITQRHQGKLSCTSKASVGTEFSIQIPLQPPAKLSKPNKNTSEIAVGN